MESKGEWHSACHIAIAQEILHFYRNGGGSSSGYRDSPHSLVLQAKQAQTPSFHLPVAPTTVLCLEWSVLCIKLNLVHRKLMRLPKGPLQSHSLWDMGNGHTRASWGWYQHLGNPIISPPSQTSPKVRTGTQHKNGETGGSGHPGRFPEGGKWESEADNTGNSLYWESHCARPFM